MSLRRRSIALLYLLVCACPANTPPAGDGTTQTTTDEPPGDSTSTGDSTDTPTTDASTFDASTSDASTSDGPTGVTTGFECVPHADDETTGTTGDTGDTGDTGEPPAPIEAWQEYVTAECAAFSECGCANPKWLGDNLAGCIAARTSHLEPLATQGYVWDSDCAARRLAGVVAACAGAEMPCLADRCELFHGTAGWTEPCEETQNAPHWIDASTCEVGLVCDGSVCIPPCGNVVGCNGDICGLGESCITGYDDPGTCLPDHGECGYCGPEGGHACADGLVCTGPTFEEICERPGAAGEACVSLCKSGLYCGEHVCRPLLPADAPCTTNTSCQSLTCDPDGRCDPVPGEGEACPGGVCAVGLVCGEPSFCHPPAQLGEPCPVSDCAPNLMCGPTNLCESTICLLL